MKKTNFIICSDIDNTLYDNKILTKTIPHTHSLINEIDCKKIMFLTARPDCVPINIATKLILEKDFVMTDIILLSNPILNILIIAVLYVLIIITFGLIPELTLMLKKFMGNEKTKVFNRYIADNYKEVLDEDKHNILILLGDNGEGDEYFCLDATNQYNGDKVRIDDSESEYKITVLSFIRDVKRVCDFSNKNIDEEHYVNKFQSNCMFLTNLVCSHDEIMKQILRFTQ